MLERRKKENLVRCWIEEERERLSVRAYALEDSFLAAFYAQCVESTAADAYEIFLETPLSFNYFRENLDRLDMEGIQRFFKLAAIHHTIRIVRRRKKELDWGQMNVVMAEIYELDGQERELAELLHQCADLYQSGFQELFHKTTARYLFGDRVLSGFSFAFIGNFWYNSYSSFMGSFTGYVPFHIRLKRAQ
ncbi:hypothetical protein [Anaerotignum sp.]|nr:hypothetical protein [Anaerotignum sp.]MBQ7759263.1 hypothetical protein [Anaerotignum sp.]